MLRSHPLFISCPKGLEYILSDELSEMGCEINKVNPSGVEVNGNQTILTRICLWSRIASRVLLALGQTRQADRRGIYELAAAVQWRNYLTAGQPYWISAVGQHGNIKNSKFGAQVVKDAINDQFRGLGLLPPVIDRAQAGQILQLSIGQRITLAVDAGGRSLHQRGYRLEGEQAPLKENLAAALLIRSGWPDRFCDSKGQLSAEDDKLSKALLYDPMCGSGTLIIEGAMMAMDIAPGLLNPDFAFLSAPWFDQQLWQHELSLAQQRALTGKRKWRGVLCGADSKAEVIRAAKRNVARAGLDRWIELFQQDATAMTTPASVYPASPEPEDFSDLTAPVKMAKKSDPGSPGLIQPGQCLLICNPPYGERLGQELELRGFYQTFGRRLKSQFAGWQASVFTSNKFLARELALQASKEYKFFNGKLSASLYLYDIYKHRSSAYNGDPGSTTELPRNQQVNKDAQPRLFSKQAQMFANRLAKNNKRLERWRQREQLQAYRLYDADLPEYAVAIDRYGQNVCIQEYAPPKTIDPDKAQQRILDVLEVVSAVLELPQHNIFLKQRRKQKGTEQYQRLQQRHQQTVVEEYGCKFQVNLSDYLDTGLFLDHRPVRKYIQQNAAGKTFLNLFCYTATASVHAARGGATSTTNVDLSNTYLTWAKENFRLNQLLGREAGTSKGTAKLMSKSAAKQHQHRFEQCDVQQWLNNERGQFDIIFLDPPTFSNSKKMQVSLDIQRDHADLINAAMKRLNKGGLLIFSSNYKRFKLDPQLQQRYQVRDKTAFSLPEDFARKRSHQCWFIQAGHLTPDSAKLTTINE